MVGDITTQPKQGRWAGQWAVYVFSYVYVSPKENFLEIGIFWEMVNFQISSKLRNELKLKDPIHIYNLQHSKLFCLSPSLRLFLSVYLFFCIPNIFLYINLVPLSLCFSFSRSSLFFCIPNIFLYINLVPLSLALLYLYLFNPF